MTKVNKNIINKKTKCKWHENKIETKQEIKNLEKKKILKKEKIKSKPKVEEKIVIKRNKMIYAPYLH